MFDKDFNWRVLDTKFPEMVWAELVDQAFRSMKNEEDEEDRLKRAARLIRYIQ